MSYTQRLAGPSSLARADITDIQLLALGDSGIYGAGNNESFGGPSVDIYRLLRLVRGDVRMVGTLRDHLYPGTAGTPTWFASRYVLGDPFHEGHSGFRNEQLTTGWPTYKAAYDTAGWSPSCVLLSNGANNIGQGQSAATAYGHLVDLIAAVRASYPAAPILLGTTPPFVGFSAPTVDYNALILATEIAGVYPFEFWGDLGRAEQVGDVHPNAKGNSRGAARAVALFERLFPVRRGLPAPRAFRLRQAQTALRLTDAADYATLGKSTTAGVEPGAGTFAFAFTVWPSAIGAGNHSLGGYNSADGYNPGGFTLMQDGASVSVYFAAGAPVLVQIENLLSTSAPTRIALTADPADKTIALWANGKLRQQVQVVGAWTMATGKKAFVGNADGYFDACPGWYRDVVVARGVPRFVDAGLRLMIERDYYDGDLFAGNTSVFPLDDGVTDPVGQLADADAGTDGGEFAGIGATVGNVKAMPWDWA